MIMIEQLAVTGAVLGALHAGHNVGDHWVQTDAQACTKDEPGWVGRRACAAHVVTHTLTLVAALALLAGFTGWRPEPANLIVGLLVNAVTHYVADRRAPLLRLATLAGHTRFWHLGLPREGRDDNPSIGTGRYALDQAWHHAWLLVSALIIGAEW